MTSSPSPVNSGWVVLLATTMVHMVMTCAAFTLAAIAPEVAADLDIPTAYIGFQVSIVMGCGMFTALVAGSLIARWGACRILQSTLFLGGFGCALTAVPDVFAVAAGSLVIGFAYGMPTAAASHLLARFAAGRHRNLLFSIKQSGVPLGAMVRIGHCRPAFLGASGSTDRM